jgi:chromosome segregation ATPase
LESELTQNIRKSEEDLKSLESTKNYLDKNIEENEASLKEMVSQFQKLQSQHK